MKKLIVPIVNRTNYTKLKSILTKLIGYDTIEVDVILSSGIVVRKLTDSANDIYCDNVPVTCEIDCLLMNDSLECMAKSLGVSLIEHSGLLSREKPDVLLAVGDRYDMLAPVLSAKILNIPIIHIQGGERSGSIDDNIRDIITICSEMHLVSTEQSYKNVVGLVGDSNVYNVGCPAVEMITQYPQSEYLCPNTFKKHFKDQFEIAKNEPYFLIIVHPNTTEDCDVNMEIVLQSALLFGYKCIVIYPNIDAFNNKITQSIRRYHDKIICIKHAPSEDFSQLLFHSKCLIGNSSSGIREAASFKIPVVNIGNRQRGREQNDNTFNTVCEFDEIVNCINIAMSSPISGNNIYFKHGSSRKICEYILSFMGC